MGEVPDLIRRPFLDGPSACQLLEEHYHLKASTVKELKSFGDQNFLMTLDTPLTASSGSRHGEWDQVILKVFNSEDSADYDRMNLIVSTMSYLWRNNFCCPLPVTNVHGTQMHLEKIDGNENGRYGLFTIVLLTYLPGTLMGSLKPVPQQLCFEVGKRLANMHLLMKDFPDSNRQSTTSVCNLRWSLLNLTKQRNLLTLISEPTLKTCVAKVIDLFEENVVPVLPSFRRGIIHNDVNDNNVIVTRQQQNYNFGVAGIIDFGDVEYNYLIFDIAIAMSEMMIAQTDDAIGAAGQILSGYSSVYSISDEEREQLYHVVLARYAQRIILCLDARKRDPDNTEITRGLPRVCNQLKRLLDYSKREVDLMWNL